jgi:hypothetical protein
MFECQIRTNQKKAIEALPRASPWSAVLYTEAVLDLLHWTGLERDATDKLHLLNILELGSVNNLKRRMPDATIVNPISRPTVNLNVVVSARRSGVEIVAPLRDGAAVAFSSPVHEVVSIDTMPG